MIIGLLLKGILFAVLALPMTRFPDQFFEKATPIIWPFSKKLIAIELLGSCLNLPL